MGTGRGTVLPSLKLARAGDNPTVQRFIDSILALPRVVECHMMAGDCDFLLGVIACDLDAYLWFQAGKLARIEGVRSLKTDIPLQRIKLTGSLPYGFEIGD